MYDSIIGKRIRLLSMKNEQVLHKGDLGTVESINTVHMGPRPFTQIWVKWDNGSSIAILPEVDRFEVV